MQQHAFSLAGKWQLFYYPEKEGLDIRTPEALASSSLTPIAATVPGNVELDLMTAGIGQDPYYGTRTLDYRKYEFYSWWFQRDFEIPAHYAGKEILVCFEGLDTYGSVFVNGALVGESANMLIPHTFDITAQALPGAVNTIAVHISSPINRAREVYFPAGIRIWETMGDEFLAIRKPAHSFGWDISARLLSAGLWREVTVRCQERTRLKEVYYALLETDPNAGAVLSVRYRFATEDPQLTGFTVRLRGSCNGHSFEAESPCLFVSGKLTTRIPDPQYWWPRGYGEAHLYQMTFELLQHGQVVDSRQEAIGLRRLELQRSYEGRDCGEFKFLVNGVPILVKGTNWVPLDCMHSRDLQRLPEAHALLNDIGCNMVRMWGGNVYESDAFYDLCDQRGILVWQDFSLACGLYDQGDDFCKIIEEEAAATIIRLRNHPSIAIWAGDNEIDAAYWQMGHTLPHARYNRISREILPRAVAMHDPYRDYIPSSPVIEGENFNGDGDLSMPEQHNWGPRDYFKGDFYKHSKAHFISETGYHGCPAVSSLKKFIPPEELWPYSEESPSWAVHNSDYLPAPRRDYDRNVLMRNQVKALFGKIPDELEDFALASQISQAEAKKFFIENTRIQKWRRTGILWWNLLDGWPQISDAVVDYYFTKKLAYHYIKRLQYPVLMMMGEGEAWRHPVCLSNDSNRPYQVSYTLTCFDDQQVLLSGEALLPANENIALPPISTIPGQQSLYLLEWEVEGQRYGNHYASGFVPMDFARYRTWLQAICALPEAFEPEACYR